MKEFPEIPNTICIETKENIVKQKREKLFLYIADIDVRNRLKHVHWYLKCNKQFKTNLSRIG